MKGPTYNPVQNVWEGSLSGVGLDMFPSPPPLTKLIDKDKSCIIHMC